MQELDLGHSPQCLKSSHGFRVRQGSLEGEAGIIQEGRE